MESKACENAKKFPHSAILGFETSFTTNNFSLTLSSIRHICPNSQINFWWLIIYWFWSIYYDSVNFDNDMMLSSLKSLTKQFIKTTAFGKDIILLVLMSFS